MTCGSKLQQGELLFALSGLQGLRQVQLVREGTKGAVSFCVVCSAELVDEHLLSIRAANLAQGLYRSFGRLVALSSNAGEQSLLAGLLVVAKPIEDVALGFLAERLVLLSHGSGQFVAHKLLVCVEFQCLHTQGTVLVLQDLEQFLARSVGGIDEFVVSLSVRLRALLGNVGDVILLGEQTQFVLEELLGVLVALCGNGLLQSFAYLGSPSLVGAGIGDGSVDGIFYFGIDVLCCWLEHGGKHGDGLRCSLNKGLHLVVEVGLLLYRHECEHILYDGLGSAVACVLCKGGHRQQERCYNNI